MAYSLESPPDIRTGSQANDGLMARLGKALDRAGEIMDRASAIDGRLFRPTPTPVLPSSQAANEMNATTVEFLLDALVERLNGIDRQLAVIQQGL